MKESVCDVQWETLHDEGKEKIQRKRGDLGCIQGHNTGKLIGSQHGCRRPATPLQFKKAVQRFCSAFPRNVKTAMYADENLINYCILKSHIIPVDQPEMQLFSSVCPAFLPLLDEPVR
jgi:hypothetical protein